jgi:hypothetical protein
VAAAVVAFLLYAIWVAVGEWTGLRAPPHAADRLPSKATAEDIRKAIREKLGRMQRGEFPAGKQAVDEPMVTEIFHLARRLREMEGTNPPRCLTDFECRKREAAERQEWAQKEKAAEARAAEAHACARARGYALVEELALDASYDRIEGGGGRLWGRLSDLRREEEGCLLRKEYDEGLARHLKTLAGLVAELPEPFANAPPQQYQGIREGAQNIYALLQAYAKASCWSKASPLERLGGGRIEGLVRNEYWVSRNVRRDADPVGATAEALRQRLLGTAC